MTAHESVLITGATGFIGGYIVEHLLRQGYRLYIAVRRESNLSKLAPLPIQTVELDYTSTEQMRVSLQQLPTIDYVVHAAGITKSHDVTLFREVNAEQTKRLLEALPEPPKRFFLLSSMGSFGLNSSAAPLSSDMPRRPNTAYGESKLLAEQYVAASGIPYTILCPTGVYGVGERDYLLAINTMRRSRLSFVSGWPRQRLSFVYVRDVARAVAFLLHEPRAVGETYLLSDGREYSDSEFTQIVRDLTAQRIWQVRVPTAILWVACQVGEWCNRLLGCSSPLNRDKYPILRQRNWLCDISPLRELGFEPLYDLRRGLAETLGVQHES